MDEDELAKAKAEMLAHWGATVGDFVVHPDNADALRLFMAMASQWRNAALTTATQSVVVRTGLDYGVLNTVAELEGLAPITRGTFHRLRLIEAEAMAAWREDRERAA